MTLSRHAYRNRGFTLVELSIVLVIVALMIGGLLMTLSAQEQIKRAQETQRVLTEARDALLGFAVANGRLPRPAVSALNGQELTAGCTDDNACTGFIPWQTLGVSKLDGWGKIIRYSVSPAFSNDTPFSLTSATSKRIMTRDDSGNLIYLAGKASCEKPTDCIPVVLYSQGNRNFGTSDAGIALPNTSTMNTDEMANDTGSTSGTVFISRTPSDSTTAPGEFDDLVVWISPHILFNRMITAGRLP